MECRDIPAASNVITFWIPPGTVVVTRKMELHTSVARKVDGGATGQTLTVVPIGSLAPPSAVPMGCEVRPLLGCARKVGSDTTSQRFLPDFHRSHLVGVLGIALVIGSDVFLVGVIVLVGLSSTDRAVVLLPGVLGRYILQESAVMKVTHGLKHLLNLGFQGCRSLRRRHRLLLGLELRGILWSIISILYRSLQSWK
jgi:hypothetical protein